MARVTVEDCVERIPNRFDLVMTAAQRSREISAGAQITLERDNDKNPVVALREIADETVEIDQLQDSLVRGLQKVADMDEPEEEDQAELIAGQTGAEEGGEAAAAPIDSDDPFAGAKMPMFEDITPDEINKE